MKQSKKDWVPRDSLSHIYAENRALEYPMAQAIIAELKHAILVPIDNYKVSSTAEDKTRFSRERAKS